MPADSSVPPIARLGHWPFTILLVGIVVAVAAMRSCGGSGGGSGPLAPAPRAPTDAPPRGPSASRTGEAGARPDEATRGGAETGSAGGSAGGVARGNSAATAGDQFTLLEAIVEKQRDVWVEFEAKVVKALPDDTESPRHQRFLLELPSGDSILIAHNIEVAPRAPIRVGATARVKGRYEWNDRGGVVHWTHRDERRGQPAGWIEVGGRRFE